MPYESSYEIAKAIKIDLEERSLISDDFKLKVLNEKNAHRVDKNAFNRNAAEILWTMVHKYSRDFVNFPANTNAAKLSVANSKNDKRKIESADEDFESDNAFTNKISAMTTDAAERYRLLTELWDFRKGLLNILILEKKDVKLTFSILDKILAKELNINKDIISSWQMGVNKLFSVNIFTKTSNTAAQQNLEHLIQRDPLRLTMEAYLLELKQKQQQSNSAIMFATELVKTEENDQDDIFDDIEDFVVDEKEEERRLKAQKEEEQQKKQLSDLVKDLGIFQNQSEIESKSNKKKEYHSHKNSKVKL